MGLSGSDEGAFIIELFSMQIADERLLRCDRTHN